MVPASGGWGIQNQSALRNLPLPSSTHSCSEHSTIPSHVPSRHQVIGHPQQGQGSPVDKAVFHPHLMCQWGLQQAAPPWRCLNKCASVAFHGHPQHVALLRGPGAHLSQVQPLYHLLQNLLHYSPHLFFYALLICGPTNWSTSSWL